MAGPPSTREVLHERSVLPLLATVFTMNTATVCQATALGKQVFDLTGREIDLGLLGLAEFAPAALLVVASGHVADRFDRRRVAALGLIVELACAAGLAGYAASRPTAAGPIFALVVAFGIGRAFVRPATRSLPADIAAARSLPRLVAMYAVTFQAAVIAGPVLAGFLYAFDPIWAYVAATGLMAVAAVTVGLVRPSRAIDRSTAAGNRRAGLRSALEGLRVIRSNPILLGAISLDLVAVLFGGAVALLPAIAKNRLGVGAIGLGWLRAAGGIGAAGVGLALTVRPLTRRIGRVLLSAVTLFGAATVVLGVTHSFAWAFASLVVLSGADAISVFIRATLVPLVTPEAVRGRVLAVETVFIGASNELGAFESGVAGQLLGVGPSVVAGGLATVVVAAAWGLLFPPLRSVDRFSDLASVTPGRTTSREPP